MLSKLRNVFSRTQGDSMGNVVSAAVVEDASDLSMEGAECCDKGLCEHAVRELAYHKWEEAGRPDGDGVEFWLDAESELKAAFDAEENSIK